MTSSPSLPSSPTSYGHYIQGAFTESGDNPIERQSPAHGVPVSLYARGTAADAEQAIQAAKASFDSGDWVNTSGAERQAVLQKTANLIREHTSELGLIECLESGKPYQQSLDEMEWAAGVWDYASALCRHLHGDTSNSLGPDLFGMTLREPIGVCALITPWNFPLLIISQKLPFALAAGCSCVVKPSEFTSGTTLKLAAMLSEAGLPPGVCNVVTGHGDPVGSTFSTHPDVNMVSFTGSTAVGKAIMAAAAPTLKKVSLELGGKNPQLIFSDADLERSADAVCLGAWFNMGECCNSGSRVLVQEDIAEELVAKVLEKSQALKTGNPFDDVSVGAIINEAQYEKIQDFIRKGKAAGADLVLDGSGVEQGQGRFIAPTIFDKVPPDADIACDEIFGPVLSIVRFKDEAEALQIANSSWYGLSASVWTSNTDRALRCTRSLKAGTVWVNTFLDGAPELPFGGYKQSGLGRELGPEAVLEYTETKTVTMRIQKT